MDELRMQAEALGIKVDGRWSEQRLKEEIAMNQTNVQPREKTLHELNMEARAIDRAMRDAHREAGEAAKSAVEDTLNRVHATRRVQKPLRVG